MMVDGFTYLEIGRHMSNFVSQNSANIKNDTYFNDLCKNADILISIGMPFYPKSITSEEMRFVKHYVEEYMS